MQKTIGSVNDWKVYRRENNIDFNSFVKLYIVSIKMISEKSFSEIIFTRNYEIPANDYKELELEGYPKGL